MSTVLPNMALVVPATGDGDYPTSISTSLSNVDNHDHTSGKGLQIPTAGIADSAVTGVKLAAAVVDNSTLEKVANQLRVKDLGITNAKLAAVGEQVSASCGAFVHGNATPTDVTNLSVSITTIGRPVMVMLISDGSGAAQPSVISIQDTSGASTGVSGIFRLLRGASEISHYNLVANGASGPVGVAVPASSFQFLDVVAAGTYTYKVQVNTGTANTNISCNYAKLVAFEL